MWRDRVENLKIAGLVLNMKVLYNQHNAVACEYTQQLYFR